MTVTLTTDAKLVARNGRVIHATAPHCIGVALCAPNMASEGYAPVLFAELADRNAPVTCKNCCRKLGIEAPKSLPTVKQVKAMIAAKPEPTVTEQQAEIEAQRAAMVDNTAAMCAVDAGVNTWAGESYAAYLPGGELASVTMDMVHGWAEREYRFELKLRAKAARKAARAAR